MIEHLHYLLTLAACLGLTLPLEPLGAGVYRQPRRVLRALQLPVALFVAWDLSAIARGHWTFDEGQTLPWRLPGSFPIEELLFFVVVPLCTILTFEAVRGLSRPPRRTKTKAHADA
jgi:lycopene cyclase domain-containing protein